MTGRPLSLDATAAAVTGAGRRMRMHAFVVLALTFVAGLALGWGVAHRVGAAGRVAATPGDARGGYGRPGGGGGGPPRQNMQQQLGLSDVQCNAIDSVFASRRGQIDAFWRGPGGQLRAILDSTGADVRTVLDSAQRLKLDSLNAHRRQRGGGGGGKGGPDGRGPDGRGGRFCTGRDGPPGPR